MSSLLVGAALCALTLGSSAYGQATDTLVELEELTVTGSYIPQTETAFEAGTYPVVKLDRKAIEQTGYKTAGDLLQKLTVNNANAVPLSNNATGFTPGASSVSLRGLGPEATLVLINGRRVAPYPVGQGGTTAFIDLNSIPLSAVERIEVLKDGASATYGADAVAGVVNIITRRGFDGTEAFVSYGNTTDKDAAETVASIITGATTEKAKMLVGINFYDRNDIFNRDREYSAVPPFLSSNSSPLNLEVSRLAVNAALGQAPGSAVTGVSATNANGTQRNVFFTQSGATADNNGLKPASAYTYSNGRSSVFNFNELSGSYPASTRMGAFMSAERKIFDSENISLYADVSYQNVRTRNELAPSATGNFSSPGQTELIIPARTANPILTVIDRSTGAITQLAAGAAAPAGTIAGPGTRIVNGVVQRLAPDGAFNPFNPFNQDISGGTRARLAEFGNRVFRNETDALLGVVGLRVAEVAQKWNLDAAYSYSVIKDTGRNRLVSSTRFNRVLNANDSIFRPGSNDYIGVSTPYNPFGYYKNPIPSNAPVTAFASVETKESNRSQLGLGNFVMSTGDLMELPAGPLGFAFGAEYRQETLRQSPDALGLTGDLIGSSPNASSIGQRKIAGYFAEARVPLAKPEDNKTLLHSLSLDLAARYEDFLTSSRNTFVPKIGVRYQPMANITWRSSWSKGFREPSLYELFAGSTAGLVPITDPATGDAEPELDVTVSGNRRLAAEKSKNFNVGLVYTPDQVKGLTLSADFWKIERDGTVDVNFQDVVNRAVGREPDGTPAPGGLIPGESIVRGAAGNLVQINAVFRNIGVTKAEGYDFGVSYVLPTENLGRFDLSAVATWTRSFKRANIAGVEPVEVIGTDSTGTADDGYLEWRGRVQVEWTRGPWNASISGLYTDGFEEADNFEDGPSFVASTMIWDAQVNYTLFPGSKNPFLADTKLSLGVQNLFDKDPPFASADTFNSTGYPGFLYNAINRFVYLSVTKKL